MDFLFLEYLISPYVYQDVRGLTVFIIIIKLSSFYGNKRAYNRYCNRNRYGNIRSDHSLPRKTEIAKGTQIKRLIICYQKTTYQLCLNWENN